MTTIPTGIPESIPDGIPVSTKVLRLQGFNVSSLNDLLLIGVPDLSILGMKNNKINDTEALKYVHLPKLFILELQNNLLKSFDFYVLGRFKELTVVDLRNNYIKELDLDQERSQSMNDSWFTPHDNDLHHNMWNLAVDPTTDNWLIHKLILLQGNPIDCCLSKSALLKYGHIFFGNCSLPLHVQGLSFKEAMPKIDCSEVSGVAKEVNTASVADASNKQLFLVVVYGFTLALNF